ncbi:alpha-ketoacid dehydrogenase subunit beta [Bacillus massilinigeriensis]|uniref:alpha-ketoacid dehydrogenase subunit beta n=1 Tax=Bacillus massilionigeriensis TaxID=1805475 RepID=UPI00096B611C|nr:alpha-ketoacid dehydrogenase subunit beta [Bacillus massilionigeriensis]
MTAMTMIEAINFAIKKEMERDNRVICLGEDIGKNGGVFRATDGLQSIYGENRVVDTPIAESAIIGAAVGMASRGLRPIAEIQFFGFIYEAMDQMAAQAARLRFRSGGRLNASMVIRSPFGGGVRTPELHSDSLEGLFLHSPGMKVVMPSNPYDAKGLLTAAIRDNDPVLFLEPLKLYRAFQQEVPEEDYVIEIGKANVIKEGDDLTVITWGPSVPLVKSVINEYEKAQNVSIELIDLRTISPIDEETILTSVQKTGRVLIVHEAVKTGGPGAEISAIINEKALFHLSAPIIRVTGFDTPYPVPSVENEWLPNAKRITQGITQVLAH